jgi:hypothetical protein
MSTNGTNACFQGAVTWCGCSDLLESQRAWNEALGIEGPEYACRKELCAVCGGPSHRRAYRLGCWITICVTHRRPGSLGIASLEFECHRPSLAKANGNGDRPDLEASLLDTPAAVRRHLERACAAFPGRIPPPILLRVDQALDALPDAWPTREAPGPASAPSSPTAPSGDDGGVLVAVLEADAPPNGHGAEKPSIPAAAPTPSADLKKIRARIRRRKVPAVGAARYSDHVSPRKGTCECGNHPMYSECTMPFGKHKGTAVTQLPDSYLHFLNTLPDLYGRLSTCVQHELHLRFPETFPHEAFPEFRGYGRRRGRSKPEPETDPYM